MNTTGILIAGFGGQGVMLAGKLLAAAGMRAGLEVTYMPSYGAEVRGGTANCMVILSPDPIALPLVFQPDILIAMNRLSYDRFGPRVRPGGIVIRNISRTEGAPAGSPGRTLDVPADDIARDIGAPKSANLVALGAAIQAGRLFPIATAIESIPEMLSARYSHLLKVNAKALALGAEAIPG
ncbi:MAG: 2-oxoacid:acceptor oxidoreductase family protein [Planctomycetota bacterium]